MIEDLIDGSFGFIGKAIGIAILLLIWGIAFIGVPYTVLHFIIKYW